MFVNWESKWRRLSPVLQLEERDLCPELREFHFTEQGMQRRATDPGAASKFCKKFLKSSTCDSIPELGCLPVWKTSTGQLQLRLEARESAFNMCLYFSCLQELCSQQSMRNLLLAQLSRAYLPSFPLLPSPHSIRNTVTQNQDLELRLSLGPRPPLSSHISLCQG